MAALELTNEERILILERRAAQAVEAVRGARGFQLTPVDEIDDNLKIAKFNAMYAQVLDLWDRVRLSGDYDSDSKHYIYESAMEFLAPGRKDEMWKAFNAFCR